MQTVKETAANIAASALSGMEKTKAVIEEKAEKMNTSNPIEKDMATLRKEDRIRLAELRKQEAYSQNAAAAATDGGAGASLTAVGSGDQEMITRHRATAGFPNMEPTLAQDEHGTTVQSTTPSVQPTNTMSR